MTLCTCNSSSTSAAIYAAGLKYIGTKEIPGRKANALISQWIKQSAEWLDADDSATAWCGCFRGHLGMVTATGVPRAYYRARSWLDWGRAIDHKKPSEWQQGDTVIMSRTGGQHVCLFSALSSKASAQFLGGNQGDKVSIAEYPLSRVIGVRRL